MRVCKRCDRSGPLEDFKKSNTCKEGRSPICKACHNRANRIFNKTEGGRAYYAVYQQIRRSTSAGQKYQKQYGLSEKEKTRKKIYKLANLAKYAAMEAKRRATRFNATPSWLSKEQVKEIEGFYLLAKELQWLSNEPLEVDHIIPLQGENVVGLHVPWNLQILPRAMNISKRNKVG